MATMSYNGVNLPFVDITQFEVSARYDEMGQTDWYITDFDIAANFILNTNYFKLRIGSNRNPVLTNPADIMNVIRSLLLKPRKTLSIQFNGVNLIPQAQSGLTGTVDAQNGPRPQSCTPIRLTNTTFLMIYRIKASYWENNSLNTSSPAVTNQQGGNVLYNRWTETADIDATNFTTRTREGQFMIRSDNPSGFIVDQVRNQMAIVGVPPGFLRESAHYQVAADGLTLKYRVVDKEVPKMPPYPAFKADGHFVRTTPTAGNPFNTAAVHIRLDGDNSIDPATNNWKQTRMMSVAMAVAMQKLKLVGYIGNSFLTKCEVRAGMYANWVEVDMAAKLGVEKQGSTISPLGTAGGILASAISPAFPAARVAGILLTRLNPPPAVKNQPLINYNFGFTPISDDPGGFVKPGYLLRGTATLLLETAAYYDPSVRNSLTSDLRYGRNSFLPDGSTTNLAVGDFEPGQAGLLLEP